MPPRLHMEAHSGHHCLARAHGFGCQEQTRLGMSSLCGQTEQTEESRAQGHKRSEPSSVGPVGRHHLQQIRDRSHTHIYASNGEKFEVISVLWCFRTASNIAILWYGCDLASRLIP